MLKFLHCLNKVPKSSHLHCLNLGLNVVINLVAKLFFVENMLFFLSKSKMCNKTKKAPVQEFFWLEKTTKFLVQQQKSLQLCSEMLKPFMAQILTGVATFCHALFDLLAQSSQVLGDSLDGSRIIYGEK